MINPWQAFIFISSQFFYTEFQLYQGSLFNYWNVFLSRFLEPSTLVLISLIDQVNHRSKGRINNQKHSNWQLSTHDANAIIVYHVKFIIVCFMPFKWTIPLTISVDMPVIFLPRNLRPRVLFRWFQKKTYSQSEFMKCFNW